MDRIGKVTAIPKELCIEWKIQDFWSLSNLKYSSPSFSFEGASWHLDIYPNGYPEDDTTGHVDLYIYRDKSGPPLILKYYMGLKSLDEKNFLREDEQTFENIEVGYGFSHFVSRSELMEMKSDLMPSNTLTIICTIKCPGSTDDRKFEELSDDFKRLMESGDHSDTTIQVKGQEFRLHRSILGARNPFFDSMFKSDMKEKNTGVVTIDDCESDIFRSFVHFVYTGTVDTLSLENVCGVYEVADKYQQDQLKQECLEIMMKSISGEYFCDFITIALRHDEKELLERATIFFSHKTKEIICSVKWLAFLQAHPVYANELHIKALDEHKDK